MTLWLSKALYFVVSSDPRFWQQLVMSFLLMGLCFFIFRPLVSGALNSATAHCCVELCSLLVESITVRNLTSSVLH